MKTTTTKQKHADIYTSILQMQAAEKEKTGFDIPVKWLFQKAAEKFYISASRIKVIFYQVQKNPKNYGL